MSPLIWTLTLARFVPVAPPPFRPSHFYRHMATARNWQDQFRLIVLPYQAKRWPPHDAAPREFPYILQTKA